MRILRVLPENTPEKIGQERAGTEWTVVKSKIRLCIYYQCSSSKQNKGSCTSHNLRDEKLYNIVRNALQIH